MVNTGTGDAPLDGAISCRLKDVEIRTVPRHRDILSVTKLYLHGVSGVDSTAGKSRESVRSHREVVCAVNLEVNLVVSGGGN